MLSELHKKATAAGITIIGGDTPDISDNPVAKFHRRVMWAYIELEKELAVHRMQHGLKERQKGRTKQLKDFDKDDKSNKALQEKAQLTMQDGSVKYNGCTSILQSCMPLLYINCRCPCVAALPALLLLPHANNYLQLLANTRVKLNT